MKQCLPQMNRRWMTYRLAFTLLLIGGCQAFVDDADREVYRLLDKRQAQALGEAHQVRLGRPDVSKPVPRSDQAYKFVPHQVDPEIPDEFQQPATRPSNAAGSPPLTAVPELVGDADEPLPDGSPLTQAEEGLPEDEPDVTPQSPVDANSSALRLQPAPAARDDAADESQTLPRPVEAAAPPSAVDTSGVPELTLAEALTYAFQHAREFQTAKEDLYLAALALTLERFLWTPQFNGSVGTLYNNAGQLESWDQTLDTVARVGVEQRLPLGGRVSAAILGDLMRDLTQHVTNAETGQALIEADIPLLRGAGRVAFESRYQAERNLIYAIRTFERFRRAFAVEIAGEFFDLQQLRQEIVNTDATIKSFEYEVGRATALWQRGRLNRLEAQRAEQNRLINVNRRVSVVERYKTALDQFKIRIGMPVEQQIEIPLPEEPSSDPDAPLDARTLEDMLQMPAVSQEAAIEYALRYRLDLINELDAIDDAARGVVIAENQLLPDLSVFGRVQFNTQPEERGMLKYNTERTTYQAGVNLELPLNRQAERNELRRALILKERAQRNYELARDVVAQQVRRAMRRVQLAQTSLDIQLRNRDLALERRRAASILFDKGQVSNREVVDAEEFLLDARNQLAQAQANLRLEILQFRRDTETLRIDDSGHWKGMSLTENQTRENRPVPVQ